MITIAIVILLAFFLAPLALYLVLGERLIAGECPTCKDEAEAVERPSPTVFVGRGTHIEMKYDAMTRVEEQTQSRLTREIAAILRSPCCRNPLNQDSNGGYACASCGRSFPANNNVTSFVEGRNYSDSFGFQWQLYSHTQLDTECGGKSEAAFHKRTGFTPEQLRGKLVLDVGCGMGRFAEVATRWGAQVVGIDLSAAAAVAARNLRDRAFVAFQADVFALPFAPASFDYIYSIGVLHHTPDCEKAVKELPKYLKPGGGMAVWLYSGYNKWYGFSDIYRKITRRMPPRLLHGILGVTVPCLYWLDCGLRRIPVFGRPMAGLVHYLFPVSRNPKPDMRLLDTFDWYSPRYQSKHTYEQVFRWFENCGMEDLHVGDVPISVRGCKPSHRALIEFPESVTREALTGVKPQVRTLSH